MRLLVCADRKVGLEITRFLIDHYVEDLALVVCLAENEIAQRARSAGVTTHLFKNNEEFYTYIRPMNLDLGLLAWWPNIIPPQILEVPRFGFINTHPSLLPYNRGKHPNFWAIVEQVPFGVTLHFVDHGIDSGDIIAQRSIEYDWCDNGGTLYEKAQEAMVGLFQDLYPKLRSGTIPRHPQDRSAGSYHRAEELDPVCHIDLKNTYRACDLLNLLRARTFPGYPSCWFEENGKRYEVRVEIRSLP